MPRPRTVKRGERLLYTGLRIATFDLRIVNQELSFEEN